MKEEATVGESLKKTAEVSLKETALKLADAIDNWDEWEDYKDQASDMIRKLVAELDKQEKEISNLKYEISSGAWQTKPEGYGKAVPLSYSDIVLMRDAEWDKYRTDKESKSRKTACITDAEWDVWFAKAIEERHGIK